MRDGGGHGEWPGSPGEGEQKRKWEHWACRKKKVQAEHAEDASRMGMDQKKEGDPGARRGDRDIS